MNIWTSLSFLFPRLWPLSLVVGFSLLLLTPASAVVLVDTIDNGGDFGVPFGLVQKGTTSAQITMGATAHTLDKITYRLYNNNANQANVKLTLNSDASGAPGAVLETLTPNPLLLTGAQGVIGADSVFTASGTTVLAANTKYWIVVDNNLAPFTANASTRVTTSLTGSTPGGLVTFALAPFRNGVAYPNTTVNNQPKMKIEATASGGGPSGPTPITFTLGGTPGDATTGGGAPDTAGTASIGQFDLLKRGGFLGDNGMVVFPGELVIGSGAPPVTSTPNTFMGLWKDDGTGLKLLARSGDPAPEAGGAVFDILPTVPAINDSGEVTLLATLALGAGTPTTTTDNDTGLWSELGGTGLQILIREDDDIPGLPAGTKVDKFASGAFATADTGGGTGEAAFAMTMKGTSTDSAILRTSIMGASVTAVGVVARQNTTAPGTAQNFASLNGSYTDTIRMDAAGNLTFVALVTSPSREGIWYQSVGGATEKVFLAGDPAPSTGGATFKNIKSPAIGSGGTITFRGFLNSDGDNAANTKNDGIWRGTTAGGFTCILRRGDGGYAGMPGGSLVGNVWHGWLNNNNHGAWRAWVDVNGDGLVASTANGDVQGIFTDINGAMELAIAVGDAAPGILGATFASMDLPIVGSDAGGGVEWVVFIGKVTGGGTTPGVDDQGIWRKTDAGAFALVIRAGDAITTSEGVKTIQKVDFPGSNSTDRRWEQPVMDNAGRLLIYVKFTDGSTSQVLAP